MRLPSNWQKWLIISVVAGVVGAIVYCLSPDGHLAYTPDSISYLTAARQLQTGQGLTLPDFSLFHPHNTPFTTWPPLYPLLLATGLSPALLQSVFMGVVATLAGMIYAFELRLSRMTLGPAIAVTALAWPLLTDASYVWSEVFGFVWVMSAVFFLGGLRGGPLRVWLRVSGAVIAIALAIYTRYASIVLVPALIAILLTAPATKGYRWRAVAASLGAVFGMVAPLLVRNMYWSGHLSGAERAPSHMGFFDLVAVAFEHVMASFALASMAKSLFVAAFAIVVIGFVYRLLRKRNSEPFLEPSLWVAWVASVFAFFEFFGIVVLRTLRQFDPLDTRLTSYIAPLLIIAFVGFASHVWRGREDKSWRRYSLVAAMSVLLCLSGVTSYLMGSRAWEQWRVSGSPRWPMRGPYTWRSFQPLVPKWHGTGVILAGRPLVWHFVTGAPFRRIPKAPWTKREMRELSRRANGIFVDSVEAGRLAKALASLEPHAEVGHFGRVPIMFWGKGH